MENITAETLLFQAGYLTIADFEQIGSFRRYILTYPNLEVKSSLNNSILSTLAQDRLAKTKNQSHLIDALVVRFRGRVYIIEFKVVELTDKGKALEQIKAKGYAEKFSEPEVYLIGVEFSSQERNVVGFEWEKRL